MSPRSARRVQIALGLLWLADGLLQFQPYMFGRSFVTGVLLPGAEGQPGFIGAPLIWIAHLIEPHVVLFNAIAATLQVVIGAGLLHPRTVRPALALSVVWGLSVWAGGEGFGMLLTGTASPLTGAPGAAVLYALAALICWPRAVAGRRPKGEDARILGARVLWSAVWLGSAGLWLLPANRSAGAVHAAITSAPSGLAPLTQLLRAAAAVTAGRGTAIAIAFALVSAAIGIAVLGGSRHRATPAAQILLSSLYWIVGQGLGGVFTGRATDVGTGPLMILIALMMPRPALRLETAHGSRAASAPAGHAQRAAMTSGSNGVPKRIGKDERPISSDGQMDRRGRPDRLQTELCRTEVAAAPRLPEDQLLAATPSDPHSRAGNRAPGPRAQVRRWPPGVRRPLRTHQRRAWPPWAIR